MSENNDQTSQQVHPDQPGQPDQMQAQAQEQEQEQEQAGYLSEIPSAQSYIKPVRSEVDESALIASQTGTLVEQLKTLSVSHPSVTVKLAAPLNHKLFNELVEKGYSVSKSSSFRSADGQHSESHTVTVALPEPQTRSYRNRFWLPFW